MRVPARGVRIRSSSFTCLPQRPTICSKLRGAWNRTSPPPGGGNGWEQQASEQQLPQLADTAHAHAVTFPHLRQRSPLKLGKERRTWVASDTTWNCDGAWPAAACRWRVPSTITETVGIERIATGTPSCASTCFKNYGLAPKSAADFAFLLHGFHYLKEDGVMAIILPHGVLFRGGAEAKIRRKLLDDGHIDTVIGLPANLFYSTGIPVCILVLKKCKKPDDVLFINAAEDYEKGTRQNYLSDEQIERIITTYQFREPQERYSRRVSMDEIGDNDYNLNISRYVSTAQQEEEIDLAKIHAELVEIEETIQEATARHNSFLKELGLPALPS